MDEDPIVAFTEAKEQVMQMEYRRRRALYLGIWDDQQQAALDAVKAERARLAQKCMALSRSERGA
jgi:hypothetical protein